MKKVYILGVIVVLSCAMWVSFHHTLDLYKAGKFTGGLEWPATIMAETAFIMGILSIFSARRKGTAPPGQAIMLFIVGLIIVGWSNTGAAMGYALFGKWTGVILGALIPVFIYGAESVLSHAYLEGAKQKEKPAQSHKEDVSHTGSRTNSHAESHAEPHKVSHTVSHTKSHTESHAVSHKSAHAGSHKDSRTTTQAHTQSHTAQDSQGVRESHTSSHSKSHTESHTVSHTAQAREAAQSHTGSHTDSHKKESRTNAQSHTPVQSHTAARSHNTSDSHAASQPHDPIECAKQLYAQEGSLPSIRRLAEVAGCSEWQARKALQQLKKKVG